MRYSRISLIAVECRKPGKVFVRVPGERGRWVHTDRCVVEVPCSQCNAKVGEPCKGTRNEYIIDTHYTRRYAWNRNSTQVQRKTPADDQVEEEPIEDHTGD